MPQTGSMTFSGSMRGGSCCRSSRSLGFMAVLLCCPSGNAAGFFPQVAEGIVGVDAGLGARVVLAVPDAPELALGVAVVRDERLHPAHLEQRALELAVLVAAAPLLHAVD